MIFTISTSKLLKQLQLISGALGSSSSSLPILENFLFQVEDGVLTLVATDLETFMSSEVDVMADSDGDIAMPAKILMDMLKSLPEQPISFHVDLDTCAISIMSQTGKYKLVGEPGGDFPEIPELESPEELEISSSILTTAIEKTLFAVGTDEFRPAMMGVYFRLDETGVTFVSTDAHKLVKYKRTDITANKAASFILPKKALSLLKNSLPNKDDIPVDVSYDESNVFFEMAGVRLVGRLIEARFPDYEAVIPNDNTIEVRVNRGDFQSALKRLAIFSNKTTYQVNFTIGATEMELLSKDLDFSNEATEKLDCQRNGEDIEIAFNAKFLLEILNVLKTEEVVFEMSEPNRAGLLVPGAKEEHEELLMLIMPIMLGY
jgi:DNA polymerase-3 subunit beta